MLLLELHHKQGEWLCSTKQKVAMQRNAVLCNVALRLLDLRALAS